MFSLEEAHELLNQAVIDQDIDGFITAVKKGVDPNLRDYVDNVPYIVKLVKTPDFDKKDWSSFVYHILVKGGHNLDQAVKAGLVPCEELETELTSLGLNLILGYIQPFDYSKQAKLVFLVMTVEKEELTIASSYEYPGDFLRRRETLTPIQIALYNKCFYVVEALLNRGVTLPQERVVKQEQFTRLSDYFSHLVQSDMRTLYLALKYESTLLTLRDERGKSLFECALDQLALNSATLLCELGATLFTNQGQDCFDLVNNAISDVKDMLCSREYICSRQNLMQNLEALTVLRKKMTYERAVRVYEKIVDEPLGHALIYLERIKPSDADYANAQFLLGEITGHVLFENKAHLKGAVFKADKEREHRLRKRIDHYNKAGDKGIERRNRLLEELYGASYSDKLLVRFIEEKEQLDKKIKALKHIIQHKFYDKRLHQEAARSYEIDLDNIKGVALKFVDNYTIATDEERERFFNTLERAMRSAVEHQLFQSRVVVDDELKLLRKFMSSSFEQRSHTFIAPDDERYENLMLEFANKGIAYAQKEYLKIKGIIPKFSETLVIDETLTDTIVPILRRGCSSYDLIWRITCLEFCERQLGERRQFAEFHHVSRINAEFFWQGRTYVLGYGDTGWCVAMVPWVLEKYPPSPSLRYDGTSPIHFAVTSHEASAVVLEPLIQAGFDINAKTPGGLTPLELASNEGVTHHVSTLLKHGAKVDLDKINTFLTSVIKAGDLSAAKALIVAGANIRAVQPHGFRESAFDLYESLCKLQDWKDRAHAFNLGTHPRVGRDSPIFNKGKPLPEDVRREICNILKPKI